MRRADLNPQVHLGHDCPSVFVGCAVPPSRKASCWRQQPAGSEFLTLSHQRSRAAFVVRRVRRDSPALTQVAGADRYSEARHAYSRGLLSPQAVRPESNRQSEHDQPSSLTLKGYSPAVWSIRRILPCVAAVTPPRRSLPQLRSLLRLHLLPQQRTELTLPFDGEGGKAKVRYISINREPIFCWARMFAGPRW